MRYVNEDIVLRGDEAKQFVYNLHHPNVAKIVEENRRRDKALDEVNYQETDDGFTLELDRNHPEVYKHNRGLQSAFFSISNELYLFGHK